jgi:hypothetical protein
VTTRGVPRGDDEAGYASSANDDGSGTGVTTAGDMALVLPLSKWSVPPLVMTAAHPHCRNR